MGITPYLYSIVKLYNIMVYNVFVIEQSQSGFKGLFND